VSELVFSGVGSSFSCTVSIAGAPLSESHQGVECMLRASRRLLQQHDLVDRIVGFHGDRRHCNFENGEVKVEKHTFLKEK